LFRAVCMRCENGVLEPLEKLDVREGEELQVVLKIGEESIARRFYGVLKKRRPEVTREEFLEVVEEIENEDFRGL